MAGHSKFKNIMYRKGAQDRKRAKIFAKLSREITVAAKMGGADPASNPRLRLAIAAAKSESMPKDNIQRAMEKSSADKDAADFQEVRYEGYGPGGIAVIVEALTDNRNRTASEVRSCFGKNGGNMQEAGAVAFQFSQVGQIIYPAQIADAETIFEAALEAGADNIISTETEHTIHTDFTALSHVAGALQEKFGDAEQAAMVWLAKNEVKPSVEQAAGLLRLIEALEDNDDVQRVFSNGDIDDALIAQLSAE